MEIHNVEEPERKPHRFPFDCESCNAVFNPETWHSDWSLSGELTWTRPKCGHPKFPRLDEYLTLDL
jgi:hypothetical protein